MTTITSYTEAPDLSSEDYVVLGLATCFIKEDGEVHELKVVEPIPSAALEAIVKGIPTSYEFAIATTLGQTLPEAGQTLPIDFPTTAHFCEEFRLRAFSAARTYKSHPTAQSIIPIGKTYTELNYSIERKRVLNSQRVIRNEDNVKQHEYTHKVL